MEDIKKNYPLVEEQEQQSLINFQTIYTALILNWKWFVLSLIICFSIAAIYLRYKTPIYQTYAKLLIKEEENQRSSRNSLMYAANLGTMTNSSGIDNEMEILKSRKLAEQAVKDLKLYVSYKKAGHVRDRLIYKTQEINADLDEKSLENLGYPIEMSVKKTSSGYKVTGEYITNEGEKNTFDKVFSRIPAEIGTKVGFIRLTPVEGRKLAEGDLLKITIVSPRALSYRYAGSLGVSQTSLTTTIAQLTMPNEIPQRGVDYLKQLAICYNRQANEDKNEIAIRTEKFINGRLEKINAELGQTEGQLENYKQSQNLVELRLNAAQNIESSDEYKKKLVDAEIQVDLLNSIANYMRQPENKYQPLPSNVGLTDGTAVALINKYNEIAMERNLLLRSASEASPTVAPLTSQLNELEASIKRAMVQSKKNMQMQRDAVQRQYSSYINEIKNTPSQERVLTQIARQQEVKSGLYLMLLQKREENSISLAATADKGRLIDEPMVSSKISPNSSMYLLWALLAGILIPAIVLFLNEFFRYRIEGHDDVAKHTSLPIIADVAVANETAKTKADIVVHENKNSTMEEIFRSMRTNLQFMLKEDEKVILFTSSTSGEGKTFNAANLAVSCALLDKKVILVGLDIRKPRLAELFEINDHHHGITPLLTHDNPTWDDVQKQILPSGVNRNLDLLLAGPIPPNPSELVSRKALDNTFALLRQHYDYILIDTAPVGLVTDTLQIGRVADATVFVCRADYTPKESFSLINQLSEEKKMPKMSIVINGIDMSKKKYGYYYGYGKYGKYGRYGRYGKYGKYASYGSYGTYGAYGNSNYGDKHDDSVKV